ncbi:MAG: hypothetical protein FVQ79_00740 [Planctomycetes bacterium]|nr:hypothetical protein [Planctomycetota bacterium]
MKIGWLNKFDNAALTVGSEISTLPVTNLQHVHLSKKWRTATGVKSSYFVADMGASIDIDVVALLGTNLTPAATILIRASDANPSGVPGELLDTGVVGANVITNYPAVYYELSATITARYWRIDIADASVVDNLHLGRCFMGPLWQPGNNRLWGWSNIWADPSSVTESKGGQEYVDQGPRRRVLQFALSFMTEAEGYDNPFEIARENGAAKEILVLFESSAGNTNKKNILGKIKRAEGLSLTQAEAKIFRNRYFIQETL